MFALIIYGSGSLSAMILRWALQGHHGPHVFQYISCETKGRYSLFCDERLYSKIKSASTNKLNWKLFS